MSGLKEYLEIKEILNEDDELRREFKSIWEGVVGGFYNFNQEEYSIIIEEFLGFYEFLVQLADLPKVRDPRRLTDIKIRERRGYLC